MKPGAYLANPVRALNYVGLEAGYVLTCYLRRNRRLWRWVVLLRLFYPCLWP